jgi:hypothetical protein
VREREKEIKATTSETRHVYTINHPDLRTKRDLNEEIYYVLQLLVCAVHASSLQLYHVEYKERKMKYLILLPSVCKTCDPLAFYVTDRTQVHVELFLLQTASPAHLLI